MLFILETIVRKGVYLIPISAVILYILYTAYIYHSRSIDARNGNKLLLGIICIKKYKKVILSFEKFFATIVSIYIGSGLVILIVSIVSILILSI